MEYQKITNLLDYTRNQPSKFKTKKLGRNKCESRGTYSTGSKIKFNISMSKSSLCDYSDAYILTKEALSGLKQFSATERP